MIYPGDHQLGFGFDDGHRENLISTGHDSCLEGLQRRRLSQQLPRPLQQLTFCALSSVGSGYGYGRSSPKSGDGSDLERISNWDVDEMGGTHVYRRSLDFCVWD